MKREHECGPSTFACIAAKAERIAARLRGTPEDVSWSRPTRTRELLCRQAERDGLPSVSVSTRGRVLARLGARLGTPKPVVLCPCEEGRPEAKRVDHSTTQVDLQVLRR
jgi:hypothetical protein